MLEAEVRAMGKAARKAGIIIAGGDTKVVEHGKADLMYITTTGIGRPIPGLKLTLDRFARATKFFSPARSAITASRFCSLAANSTLKRDLRSDTRSVFPLVRRCRKQPPGVRWMRDPTRGGVATSLNELARDCGLGIGCRRNDSEFTMQFAEHANCWVSIPLHIANEGQFLAVVAPEYADAALERLASDSRRRRCADYRRSP